MTWNRFNEALRIYKDWNREHPHDDPETLLREHPDLAELLQDLHQAARERDEVGHSVRGASANVQPTKSIRWRSPASLVGKEIGRYRIERKLGAGGSGVVYLAREKSDRIDRMVALKVLAKKLHSRQEASRFGLESKTLSALSDPNIATLFQAQTTDDGTPYIVMEYVRGLPITEFCEERELTVSERVSLVITISQAVQHIHQKQIVHRDLKPDNILVAQTENGPVPKIIDLGFGLNTKCEAGDRLTKSWQALGTPGYMAPEQREGSGSDALADVYALGVLAYELLTDSLPREEPTEKQVATDPSIGPASYVPLRDRALDSEQLGGLAKARSTTRAKLRKQLRGDLNQVVDKALRRKPTDRYASAVEFASDLERCLRSEPISVRRQTLLYSAKSLAKRYHR